jgi:hypothetical protein
MTKMKYRVLLAIIGLALLSGTAAYAHHSYAATYDIEESVRLEAELIRFELRSPHSYLHVQTSDENGNLQRWAVEWSAPGALGRQGVDRDTLRTGDEIILNVRPSRVSGEFRALMLTLERPKDGLSWGTNPDEVVD